MADLQESSPHDDGAADAVGFATSGNVDRTDSFAYCYGCSHDLDVEGFLTDLAEHGWKVVRR